jgi:hypothetical protein
MRLPLSRKNKYRIQLMLAHYSEIYAQFPLTLPSPSAAGEELINYSNLMGL